MGSPGKAPPLVLGGAAAHIPQEVAWSRVDTIHQPVLDLLFVVLSTGTQDHAPVTPAHDSTLCRPQSPRRGLGVWEVGRGRQVLRADPHLRDQLAQLPRSETEHQGKDSPNPGLSLSVQAVRRQRTPALPAPDCPGEGHKPSTADMSTLYLELVPPVWTETPPGSHCHLRPRRCLLWLPGWQSLSTGSIPDKDMRRSAGASECPSPCAIPRVCPRQRGLLERTKQGESWDHNRLCEGPRRSATPQTPNRARAWL